MALLSEKPQNYAMSVAHFFVLSALKDNYYKVNSVHSIRALCMKHTHLTQNMFTCAVLLTQYGVRNMVSVACVACAR